MLTYVKDEKFYSHRTELRHDKEQDELKLKLEVFRDRIRPGSKEEWRISISDGSSNPRIAELLASMYDFSLDGIYPSHPWNLSLYNFDRYNSMRSLSSDQSFNNEFASLYFSAPIKQVKPFEFDRFNWYGFSFYSSRGMMIRGAKSLNVSEDNIVVGYGQLKAEVTQESSMAPAPASSNEDELPIQTDSQLASPQVRRNFNETAFFYPQLKTNDKGDTQIVFDVPESNTKWRFRVLAHDKKLNTAISEAFTVSQKELMVTPNMPRFLRHGDRATISTKISNLSDTSVSGKVQLEFFNPATEEVVDHIPLSDQVKAFSLGKDASSEASWSFDVPKDIDL